jgi:pilus assembly protein CpaE
MSMKNPHILLALRDTLLRQEILSRLSQVDPPVVSEEDPGDWASVLAHISQARPEVLLVEVGAISDNVMNSLLAVKKAAAQTRIVALHSSDDPQLILAALRAGASEFVHPPFEETLRPALSRVIDQAPNEGHKKQGKIIGFLSAKGGCGATTLACHIAADLKRQTGERVLLADLDFTSGMVGFLMKVATKYSILDAVSNLSRLDESLWKALVTEWKPGLDVIPSPEDFFYENAPTRDELRHVIRLMRTQHDWIVLDLGRSLNETVLALYGELDNLFLTSVLEVSALHGVKSIVQKLRDRGEDLSRLELVLNRTPKMMDITQEELEKVLGRSLYAMLPNDYPSLYAAYSGGNLLPPNNRLAMQFSRLTRKLARIETPAKPKKKFSLFG